MSKSISRSGCSSGRAGSDAWESSFAQDLADGDGSGSRIHRMTNGGVRLEGGEGSGGGADCETARNERSRFGNDARSRT